MAERNVNLNSFPKLKLLSSNISSSWESWVVQFEIAIELATLNMGTEEIHGEVTNIFRGRKKLLALLSAIGNDGIETLRSLGFAMANQDDDAYDQALDLLKDHYDREESFYVKTMRFVTVSQALAESHTDYLLRVEKLSRNMGFGNNEDLRQSFCVALAVNGLMDTSVRAQLLQEQDLTWDQLKAKLKAHMIARESESLLSQAKAGSFNVKQEIKEEGTVHRISSDRRRSGKPKVYFDSRHNSGERGRNYYRSRDSSRSSGNSSSSERYYRRSSPRRYSKRYTSPRTDRPRRYNSPRRESYGCFQCNKEDHQVRDCPEAICFTCNVKGHTSQDCKSRSKSRSHRDRRHYHNNSGSRSDSSPSNRSYRRVRFTQSKD